MDDKVTNSRDALRMFDELAKLQSKKSREERKSLVLGAYSQPELKAKFDLYDEKQGKPDWSGIVGEQACSVCNEGYLGRGRGYNLAICDDCLEVHVSIRDEEIVRQEKELEIPLRVYCGLRRE